ncbi:hypothetical protein GCM10010156_13400 [Planobispora rosea]|uniref:Uncharacterized protein n=1 Tax=Planobispora rosea TaxID=35762 RepID=A0A8J3RYD7_PLARO|nr:hypothetical protein GCM10010156_13400 [Planobispora rosea]GIH83588.1 hypothetical protein Pro02_19960 [Planobispora rosea]
MIVTIPSAPSSVTPAATFMPHCRAQYGQCVAAGAFTGVGAESEIGMRPMVLSSGFTAGSLLLPLCYKQPTGFTFAVRLR